MTWLLLRLGFGAESTYGLRDHIDRQHRVLGWAVVLGFAWLSVLTIAVFR